MSPLMISKDITKLPSSVRGMTIGLFGGSFNPPHPGHQLVSRQVLKRLDLDAIWWLVTPGNPLKDHGELAPLTNRVQAATTLITHPRVSATGFEAARGFTYTFDTLKFLKNTLSDRNFVWIMGADSFAGFHKWERWREIAHLLPLVIYNRPGDGFKALSSPAATYLKKYRLSQTSAKTLPLCKPPAWVYLSGLTSEMSSSKIRQNAPLPATPVERI
ncbi:MAG: nicotinate-nucleotide adenylyltransferase [Devosiaceae bacterium]|nr:nicotinate-nucleotide adenylyltransferase [Devosiaceae bacterium]